MHILCIVKSNNVVYCMRQSEDSVERDYLQYSRKTVQSLNEKRKFLH